MGADDAGNILVLSAPAYLMEDAMQVVKLIDSNASVDTVAVVPVSRAAHPKLSEGRWIGCSLSQSEQWNSQAFRIPEN